MAYRNKNEKQTVIVDINKNDNGDVIRVTKIENDGDIGFDVRNMYTKDDGELGYTQKGVRMSKEVAVEMMLKIIDTFSTDEYNAFIEKLNSKE